MTDSTKKLQQVEGLIFDYGGTLDTNARHWAHVLWESYCEARVPVSEEVFRQAYVYGERALAKAPIVVPEDTFREVLQKKLEQETLYLVTNRHWLPQEAQRRDRVDRMTDYCYRYAHRHIEVSRSVLAVLAERYPMVLVSNFYGNIASVLRDFRLPFFRKIVESAVVGVRKPDPAIWKLGVDALGLPPDRIAIVGDSFDKDILPARSLGLQTVWLKGEGWSRQAAAQDESLPTAVITDIRQLLSLL